ncbi:MAG TPA: sugar transferase [Terracidiphilus sp.]|jgi:lipopolysaccharide/colanic/teichoic acid biosynthesis glycosyltransferase
MTTMFRYEKRLFDLAAASVLLVVAAPLMLLIAILIRLTMGSPVFFHQPRIGLNGKLFEFLKFRTMVKNQEAVLGKNNISDAPAGMLLKLRKDPRVTPLGRFLRRTSIDELPQLFNVLRGEMSVVGPRPLLPFMAVGEKETLDKRASVPGGITGWWQVKAREHNTSLNDMIAYDLHYVENASVLFDVWILCLTFPCIFSARGAH